MIKYFTQCFLAFTAFFIFVSNSSTPNNATTKAWNEINCSTSCHSGGTGITTVNLTINTSTPNTYKSDSIYTGTVTVGNSSYVSATNRWGFEITARDTSNNKIGTFTVTNATTTLIQTSGGKDFLKHKNANINVGTKVWPFTFQFPSKVTYDGQIFFYISGLAADGTGGTGGDQVKSDSFKFTKYVPPSPDINVKQSGTTYLNNSTYNYGNTFKNTNNDKVFTIENVVASTTLNITSFNITGTNAAMFTIIGTTPTTVTGGSSSNITVRFKPTSGGAKTANLVIASDDPDENPYTIILNGFGTINPPIANVKQKGNPIANGGSFNYGVKTNGTNNDTIFGLYNTGDSTLTFTGLPSFSGPNTSDFTVTVLPPAFILAGDSAFVTIRFSPGASGARSSTISIPNNDLTKNPYVITLNGTGTTAGLTPEINVKQGVSTILTAGNFNYGNKALGLFSDTIFTVQNLGTDTLKLSGISITGVNAAEFSIQSIPASNIKVGDSGLIKVRFSPTIIGAKVAKLVINNNDANENPYEINLAGTGTAPENDVFVGAMAIPHTGNYAYGSVGINKSSTVLFTIKNTGNDILHVTNCTLTGPDAAQFSFQTAVNVNIAPAGSFNLAVKLIPTTTGTKSAVLSILSDDANENPYVININANGIAPENDVFIGATAIPNNGNFNYGNIGIGIGLNKNFIIKNTGADTLKVSNCTISGVDAAEFSFLSSVTVNILPSASYNLTVRCTPISLGPKSAILNIISDDQDESPYIINLSANGVLSPDINVKSNNVNVPTNGLIDLGSIAAGSFKDTILFIENIGGDSLKFNSFSFSGTNASSFGILGTTPTLLLPNTSANVTVRFAPTIGGTFNAILNILSDDPDENPYKVNFTCISIPGPTPNINVKEGGNQMDTNSSYTFPTIPATTSTSVVFTIENNGNNLLSAINAKITGSNASEFLITSKPLTSILGSSITKLTLVFSPKTIGGKTANLVITSNDPNKNPYNIIINGFADTVPLPQIDIKVDGNSIDTNGNYEFPGTKLTTSKYVSFKILNNGLGLLKNIRAEITGTNASEYTIDIIPAIQIGGGLNTEAKVKFTPLDYGIRKANLTIYSSDAVKDTFVIFLTGNGTTLIHQALPSHITVSQFDEKIKLSFENTSKYAVRLIDINGHTLLSQQVISHSEIDKTIYQNGFYFIEIEDLESKDIYIKKIVF